MPPNPYYQFPQQQQQGAGLYGQTYAHSGEPIMGYTPSGDPLYGKIGTGQAGYKYNEMGPVEQYNIYMQQQLSKNYMDQLNRYMDMGQQRADKMFTRGGFGRLSEQRPEEIQNLLATYQRGAQQGMNAPDYAAMRDMYRSDVNNQIGTLRQGNAARAANAGVRGAAVQGLNRDADRQEYLQRLGAARQMRQDDLGFRQGQQSQYAQGLQSAIGREDDIRQYNQGQSRDEQMARLQAMQGYAQLGQAQMDRAQRDTSLASQMDANMKANSKRGKMGG